MKRKNGRMAGAWGGGSFLMNGATGQLLLSATALMMFVGCATIGPPLPPSLELPKPPSDLRAERKGNKVILHWTVPSHTTDRQRIRSLGATEICRGVAPVLSTCGPPVGQGPPQKLADASKAPGEKVSSTYTDTLPAGTDPQGQITYAIEVLNSSGRGAGLSNQIRVSLAPTLPAPEDFSAHVATEGIVLKWKVQTPSAATHLHYLCRVYRRPEAGQGSILVGEIPVTESSDYTLNDPNIEWEKTYYYRSDVVTVVEQDGRAELHVEGEDTQEIKVFAHDVFPPSVPAGLQAVFSGPGQRPFVDLVWAPVADVDLAGYNVYRHTEDAAPLKLNDQPIKPPAFRDENVTPGQTYMYSVSAVDLRGNESARSEETSERVP